MKIFTRTLLPSLTIISLCALPLSATSLSTLDGHEVKKKPHTEKMAKKEGKHKNDLNAEKAQAVYDKDMANAAKVEDPAKRANLEAKARSKYDRRMAKIAAHNAKKSEKMAKREAAMADKEMKRDK